MLFGKFHINKDFKAINHILLLAKFYIYRCKLDKINLSIDVFIAKVRATVPDRSNLTGNALLERLENAKWNA